jgi:hypothetical protein
MKALLCMDEISVKIGINEKSKMIASGHIEEKFG